MRFYAPVEVGETRSRTPEGFLLCQGVKVARTGTLLYGPGEVPVQPGADGLIRIERTEGEVFRDETLASINGKPFVDDHPPEDVTPANWREHARGVWLNPRRGEGVDDVFILADLLVTDADAIALVDGGKVEISLGYDAEYEQLDAGLGRQRNIVVNHGALVDKGRCGPACSIGDSAMSKLTVRDFLAAMGFANPSAKTLDEELGGLGGQVDKTGATTININGGGHQARTPDTADTGDEDPKWKEMRDAIGECKSAIDKMMGDRKTGDKKDDDCDDDKTKDAMTPEAIKAITAAMEIVAPGLSVPTFDAAADAKKTRDALCRCQRRALDVAYATEVGKTAIDALLTGKAKDFDALTADTLDSTLFGAAAIMGARNNSAGMPAFMIPTKDQGENPNAIPNLNKTYADFWAKH